MASPFDRKPVEVVGAGPAGLAAALTLARAGRKAIVYERWQGVGRRFHDDFQGLENWTTAGDVLEELAELGIEASFEYRPFHEVVSFDPHGRQRRHRSTGPIFYLVRRGSGSGTVDARLSEQARAAGVELRFSTPRDHLPRGGIVAGGPHAADMVAVGYVFEIDAADGAYLAASDQLAPDGYAYLLVSQGRGTVATCLFRDFHGERTYLERTVEFFREQVGFTMRTERRIGGFGNVLSEPQARRGDVLFCGEAAGFQDALWGFGMRYAMLSGHLAARAQMSRCPTEYDDLWQKRLGGQLSAGLVNRYLYARLGDRGYARQLENLARASDARDWLRRYYAPSLTKSLLRPLAELFIHSRRREAACVSTSCDCTWCRCAHALAA